MLTPVVQIEMQEGIAEIVAQPYQIGVVQAKLFPHGLQVFFRSGGAQNDLRRVAGAEGHQGKHQNGHAERNGDHPKQPFEHIFAHTPTSFARFSVVFFYKSGYPFASAAKGRR